MSLENASREELARVAALVSDALKAAGIPCMFGEKPQCHEVAQIVVDISPGDSGVFVSWELPRADIRALHSLVESGDLNPDIRASGEQRQANLERIAAALARAGIETIDSEDDLSPYSLQVMSTPGAS